MEALKERLHVESEEADVIEVWLDSIQDLRLAELFFERDEIVPPFLFVNKDKTEGGDFMGTAEERVAVLKEAFKRGADFVDVSFETPTKLIAELVENKGEGKLIISYHNFKKTPGYAKLKKIVKEAKEKGADIIKVATFAHDINDNVDLLKLLAWGNEEGIELIVLGMGEKGKMSRVVCPLMGSVMYYAPLTEGTETAPGQIPKAELKRIWELMNV